MDLTDDEKRDAAMGLRSLAHIAEQDAKAAGNPGVQARFEEQARRFMLLAGKFEASRNSKRPAHI